MRIKQVGIILKKGSDAARRVGEELAVWFGERSIATVVDQITPDLDMLLILGGDGTLLHVADQASHLRIPVIGINLGDLGFLTEVAVDERYAALEAVLGGAVNIEQRMMLRVRHCGAAAIGEWRYALNDVVLTKGNIDQLVRISAWADDEYIATYRADGLIFSTPTGSTAYNLSAGGPIVHPDLNSLLVTPICPFMLESRSVLLPGNRLLRARVAGMSEAVKVMVDGRFAWDIIENDTLELRAAELPLLLIRAPRKSYFDILRRKLNWGGGMDSL